MDVQWYPGHMTKARRQMQEDIKLIDLVIELVDARIPLSSRNPDIDDLGRNKARLILMNKSDLADPAKTKAWKKHFREKGYFVASLDSRNRNGLGTVRDQIMEACREKKDRDRRRGIQNRPVRAMVAGIPNVGKSTFINTYAGRACAKTGNKPGVTKGKQWIRLNRDVELLDTPGILWPKFEDPKAGLRLALTGSVKDEILNVEDLSLELIRILEEDYPGALEARYGLEGGEDAGEPASALERIAEKRGCLRKSGGLDAGEPARVLERIAEKRGCLRKGGGLDCGRAAALVIDEFRSGKIGKFTIDALPGEASVNL